MPNLAIAPPDKPTESREQMQFHANIPRLGDRMGQAAGIIEPAEYQCVTEGLRAAVSSPQVNARKHLWKFESVLFPGVTHTWRQQPRGWHVQRPSLPYEQATDDMFTPAAVPCEPCLEPARPLLETSRWCAIGVHEKSSTTGHVADERRKQREQRSLHSHQSFKSPEFPGRGAMKLSEPVDAHWR